MCFIAFILKTTGSCKIFLYLQDPVITEPCIFIALGSGYGMAIILTVGQIFITARERIILDLIEMNIKIIYKNLDGYISILFRYSQCYWMKWLNTRLNRGDYK